MTRIGLLLQKCCAVHLYNEGMNQLSKKGHNKKLGRLSLGSSVTLHMTPVKTLYEKESTMVTPGGTQNSSLSVRKHQGNRITRP